MEHTNEIGRVMRSGRLGGEEEMRDTTKLTKDELIILISRLAEIHVLLSGLVEQVMGLANCFPFLLYFL